MCADVAYLSGLQAVIYLHMERMSTLNRANDFKFRMVLDAVKATDQRQTERQVSTCCKTTVIIYNTFAHAIPITTYQKFTNAVHFHFDGDASTACPSRLSICVSTKHFYCPL